MALAIALAAAASSWNPLGAPFAVLAGAGAVVLGLAAMRHHGSRRLPAAAVALGLGAAIAGVLVLLASAGVSTRPEQQLGVEARSPAEMGRLLDDAANHTREGRERARRELDEVAPPVGEGDSRSAGGKPPAAAGEEKRRRGR